MDSLTLSTIIDALINFIVSIGQQMNQVPGSLAFVMGLITWFVVEQVLRYIASWMRWLIIIGAIAGLGFTGLYIAREFLDRAPPLQLGDETLDVSDFLPGSEEPSSGF